MSTYEEWWFVNREKKYKGFLKLLQPQTRQALMVIEADKDMGKTWLINKMARYCKETEPTIPVAKVDFSNPRQIHKVQDVLGVVRVLRNQLGEPTYFYSLNRVINRFTQADFASGISGLATFRRQLETYFNLAELQELVFELGIKYENLAGQTLRAKTRELVNYSYRNNLFAKLIALCTKLRSHVDWWLDLEDMRERLTASVRGNGDHAVDDENGLITVDNEVERRHAERQISEAFFACVEALMRERILVVFLFDAIDAPIGIERWLYDELLPRLRDGQIADAVVIFTGRKTPDLTDLNMKPLLVKTRLDPFSEEYIREYIEEKRQITGLDLRTIVVTSGGVPGELAMMADRAMAIADDDDDFFNDL